VSLNRSTGVKLFLILIFSVLCVSSVANSQVDTLKLVPIPPGFVDLVRIGGVIGVVWSPQHDSLSSVVGSKDFRDWYCNDLNMSHVDILGYYIGDIDRTITCKRNRADTVTVGVDTSIVMEIETYDRYDTYRKKINIGTHHYTPGDSIPITLVGEKTGVTLDLGVDLVFGPGDIGISRKADVAAFFEFDLQDFEGFHVWRGFSPYPSDMKIIMEYSKEDAYKGKFFNVDQFEYEGQRYYAWIDNNVFVGFKYYYIVTCFDRGYFKGSFEYNKKDNFICDEDLGNPADTLNPVRCEDVALPITMTVDAGREIELVYAVPNPYRTGTSAETTPYYHNFYDNCIKFFNVPKEANLKIYTVSGDLVWEKYHYNPEGDNGIVSWDTRNKEGHEVASGVYIYRCERISGSWPCPYGKQVYGRIVIIR
jgi:hypothetical protein